MGNRIENSLRNTSFAMAGQAVSLILSFVTRTFFIKYLDASYLGINGLFTNILSMLSFAELGFGTAIIYELYKPLAENNQKKIAALMNLFKSIYRFVGCFILLAGSLLIPFLDFFIEDTAEIPQGIPALWVVYVLYLLNSAASYFFNYKRSLIIASQNGYIDSLNTLTFNLLRNVLQIAMLVFFRAFIPYLVVQILCTFLGNVFISIKADKLFPYLKKYNNEKIDKVSLKNIAKNVSAMACHKLGSVLVSGVDNLLISKFVGLIAAGYYSNYTLLTKTVRTLYIQLFSAITASVGNFVAEKSSEDNYVFYRKLFFFNGYIAVFCSSCLATLINPFITILWGKEYVFGTGLVLIIILNFYLTCCRQASDIFIDTKGLFWQVRWKSVIEAVINLISSVALAKYLELGITGVMLGTTISTLCTNFWWEPYVVFKYVFHKNVIGYFKQFFQYFIVVMLSIAACVAIEQFIPITIIGFSCSVVVSVVIPNVMMWILFRKTVEYDYFRQMIGNVINRAIKRNKR